jgi:hypothetical protein
MAINIPATGSYKTAKNFKEGRANIFDDSRSIPQPTPAFAIIMVEASSC